MALQPDHCPFVINCCLCELVKSQPSDLKIKLKAWILTNSEITPNTSINMEEFATFMFLCRLLPWCVKMIHLLQLQHIFWCLSILFYVWYEKISLLIDLDIEMYFNYWILHCGGLKEIVDQTTQDGLGLIYYGMQTYSIWLQEHLNILSYAFCFCRRSMKTHFHI